MPPAPSEQSDPDVETISIARFTTAPTPRAGGPKEHGDINRPIVVGSLWSKKQEPVEINQSGKNNTKLIKSRAGHRIIFDDKEGAEKITIVDKTKKNKIVLDSVNKIVKIESD